MRRNAFTLIELLVVIAILAVLISILLPALGRARRAAVQSACLSNIKDLQIASMMYSLDNEGDLVEWGLTHGGGADEDIAWIVTLRDYMGEPLVVHSPGDRSPHWPKSEGGQGVPIEGTGVEDVEPRFRRTSYGINNYITRSLPVEVGFDDNRNNVASQFYNDLDKIKQPSTMIQFLFMAETGEFAGADHVHVEDWFLPFAPGDTPKFAAEEVAIGRYGGGEATWASVSNYGFLDGHASSHRFREVFENPESNLFDPRIQ